jgi:hypothetical protein
MIHCEYRHPWDSLFEFLGVGTAEDHNIHHLLFKFNYGHFFMWWDWLLGTYKAPHTVKKFRSFVEWQEAYLKSGAASNNAEFLARKKELEEAMAAAAADEQRRRRRIELTKDLCVPYCNKHCIKCLMTNWQSSGGLCIKDEFEAQELGECGMGQLHTSR